jgi:hypothetical protein
MSSSPPANAMKNLNIGTIAGPVLRRPTHHGMAGRTSFEAHSKGMSHQFKPVEPQFAQASFAQGGYFPRADHSLI